MEDNKFEGYTYNRNGSQGFGQNPDGSQQGQETSMAHANETPSAYQSYRTHANNLYNRPSQFNSLENQPDMAQYNKVESQPDGARVINSSQQMGEEPSTEVLEKAPKNIKKDTPKQRKKKSTGKKMAQFTVAAALFGIVAGASFEGIHYGSRALFGDNKTSTEAVVTPDVEIGSTGTTDVSTDSQTVNYDVADIVKNVSPSIVSITTTTTKNYDYFFQNYEDTQSGAGSGVIIGKTDDTLYVITNNHVIAGVDEIKVGFNDNEVVKASVKGTDENNDIAVVAIKLSDIKEDTLNSIKVATVGNSDELQVGEPAIAYGNAMGYGQSVTVGYVSAVNREVESATGTFIQTDAAINPGNSGGALFNAKGEVIGINSSKYVDSRVEGMGFSIPINRAMSIANDIISGKAAEGQAYLGIMGANVGKQYSQIYGFPEGIFIREFTENSNAEKSGLQAGDVIVEIDGQSVYTMEELQNYLKTKNSGDKVKVKYYRSDAMGNYEANEVEVTLGSK